MKDILAGLRESGCHKKIESDKRLQGAIELNLMDEAARAEELFKSLNETFKEEIEQTKRAEKGPYMNFGSKSGSLSSPSGGSHVCNSCGMIIGLFNEHSC